MRRELIEAIKTIGGTQLIDTVYLIDCTVNSVDRDALTCDCTPIGGDADTDIPDVLLMAENNDGLVVFPTVGSTVKVAFSTRTDPFVIQWSEIDEVQIYIAAAAGGNATIYDIKQGAQQFNDGSYGGMVIVMNLISKINRLEEAINTLVLPVSGATAGPPSTPPCIPVTVQADLENTLITHGK